MPAVRVVNSRFCLCTSLVPRPIVAFDLGMRLHVHMRTKLENGVLHNSFSNQGEFEAMKTLSGWEATCCEEHQFRAKIKVST